ncbi:hypothetical protein I3843_16G026700 [Carya illinoinensis]|nr:hypothetical protein I3843_16G026700 [Carya illinoinensis]
MDSTRVHDIWNEGFEDRLVDMLYEDTLMGRLRGGRITNGDNVRLAEQLSAVGHKKFNFEQNFKTWGCPRYEQLCAIFGCAVATGTMQRASTHPAPDSDDERFLDEEMLNRGRPSPTPFSASYTSGSRRRQRGGPTMDEGLQARMNDTLEEICRSVEARREVAMEVMESSRSRKRSKGEHSMEFDGAFDLQMHCMKLLEQVQPSLSTEQFNKAFDRLLLTKVQRSFVSISKDRRSKWAWSL